MGWQRALAFESAGRGRCLGVLLSLLSAVVFVSIGSCWPVLCVRWDEVMLIMFVKKASQLVGSSDPTSGVDYQLEAVLRAIHENFLCLCEASLSDNVRYNRRT